MDKIIKCLNKMGSNISSIVVKNMNIWSSKLQTWVRQDGKIWIDKYKKSDIHKQLICTSHSIYSKVKDSPDGYPVNLLKGFNYITPNELFISFVIGLTLLFFGTPLWLLFIIIYGLWFIHSLMLDMIDEERLVLELLITFDDGVRDNVKANAVIDYYLFKKYGLYKEQFVGKIIHQDLFDLIDRAYNEKTPINLNSDVLIDFPIHSNNFNKNQDNTSTTHDDLSANSDYSESTNTVVTHEQTDSNESTNANENAIVTQIADNVESKNVHSK